MPSFNDDIFNALKPMVNAVDARDRFVPLVFDVIITEICSCVQCRLDKIEGFEDLDESGKSYFKVDSALSFIVRDLYSKWKQPVGYFLMGGLVKSDILQSTCKVLS